MLFGGAHRNDECGPFEQPLAHRTGSHLLQTPRVSVLIHRGRWWVLVVVAAGGAAAEWLRQPSAASVWIAWLCVAAEVAILWPLARWRQRGLALVLLALAASLTLGQRQLKAIETRWSEEREERVTAASENLAGDLHAALHRAERLAEAAIAIPSDNRVAALQVLDRMVPSAGPEMSVVVFDPQRQPLAWAGRHRLPPRIEGDSFAARASGYY